MITKQSPVALGLIGEYMFSDVYNQIRKIMDELEAGTKVVLKSGGPEMIVLRIIGTSDRHAKMDELLRMKGYADDDAYCQWIIDERSNKMKKHAFKRCMLKPFGEIESKETEPKEEDFDFDF